MLHSGFKGKVVATTAIFNMLVIIFAYSAAYFIESTRLSTLLSAFATVTTGLNGVMVAALGTRAWQQTTEMKTAKEKDDDSKAD